MNWYQLIWYFLRRRWQMPKPPRPPTNIHQGHFVAEVNRVRFEHGALPLTQDDNLMEAAESWASAMHQSGAMSHSGFTVRLQGAGFDTGSENVAYGYRTVDEAIDGWMRSHGHRVNMLGPWTHVGIGQRELHWCAIFGAK